MSLQMTDREPAHSKIKESVLIVAAEASSSLYAQRILESWKAEGREIEAFGIGSRSMEKVGFECLGRSEELAVVGLSEVLKHLPVIRRVFNSLLEQASARQPKFALLLDYPDFNLRLAKQLKKRGITVIYYISPQVWAWRTGRVKTIRGCVDHMLVLFPFEENFYREHSVKCDFVGHPLLDELPDAAIDREKLRFERSRFGLSDRDVVLGLMPGSRNSEIEHHLSTQIRAAEILSQRMPNIRTVLMVAPTLERANFGEALARSTTTIQIVKEDPLDMIALADVMLVASGTATLMVGLMEKPMVIMYRMTAITAWFAKRLVTKTKYFGLVNLVMNRLIVPELFQDDANPARLADELERLAVGPARETALVDLAGVKNALGSKGATKRVLEILNSYLDGRTRSETTFIETRV
jgi:lipid-A-disaccharide synthase